MSLNNLFWGVSTFAMMRDVEKQQRIQRRSERRRSRNARNHSKRIQDLEEDLGYVTLVLSSMLVTLDEKGTITHQEVQGLMAGLDELDGVKDGRLNVDVLRRLDEPDELEDFDELEELTED